MKIDDICVFRECHEEFRHRAADIADHDAGNEKSRHMPDRPRDDQDKAGGQHGPRESGKDQRPRRDRSEFPEQQDHHDRDAHLRACGDAKHKGPRDRVPEERLQEETGERKAPAEHRREKDPRHTDLPDDADFVRFALPRQQDPQDPVRRDMDASRIDIEHHDCRERGCQNSEDRRIPKPPPGVYLFVLHKILPSVLKPARLRPLLRNPCLLIRSSGSTLQEPFSTPALSPEIPSLPPAPAFCARPRSSAPRCPETGKGSY